MTTRLTAVDPQQATGKTKELLDAVQSKLGMTPNMMRTMANSPAVLDAYLKFGDALSHGSLSAKVREQIALVAAEENRCAYCASAHTAIGKKVGLNDDAIAAAREGDSSDGKTDATLKFARALIEKRGRVSDADLQALKQAGVNDGEVGEIVGAVALNVFTNYFNETARTDIDFPRVELRARAA